MNRQLTAFLFILICATVTMAGPKSLENPDLTKGQRPKRLRVYAMGPTGFEGWVANNLRDSATSRQILVTLVERGSPADGILKKDDVILGAAGNGDEPSPFTTDARKALAAAISDAEAKSPALLRLLRWRPVGGAQGKKGKTDVVVLTLKTMGTYSKTAPYDCPKSKKILDRGIQQFYKNGKPGLGSLGALLLMAANNPATPNDKKYQEKAGEWVYELIPDEETRKIMLDDFSVVDSSKPAWGHAYGLIVLCEYYLQTKDKTVLPAIEAYAVCFAKGQSWFGTTGHKYSYKRPDGGFNGPMAGYGAINGSGVAGFLGLTLARKCGLPNPEIAAGIKRADLFFGHFAFKGAIGYGEQGPGLGKMTYDMNGKHGTTALALLLQPNRLKEAQYFARMTACSSYYRSYSHAGPYFNYVWPILGTAAVSETLAQNYFQRTQWDHDLARRWDGRFTFTPLISGMKANGGRLPPELTALLAYTLPLKQLYITGRGHDKRTFLDTKQVQETIAAEDYSPKGRSSSELMDDFSNWSPKVRYSAIAELESRGKIETHSPRLRKMATDQNTSKLVRATACKALGIIGDKPAAEVLVKLLEDKESWVRFAAANALRGVPDDLKRGYVNDFLRAAVNTARPTFPLDPEDPVQQAHGELAMLIFYGGSASGPRGVLAKSIDGVDRSLLISAMKAVAAHPGGQKRGTIKSVYPMLSEKDILELAPSIVESVRVMSPADSMFSAGIQKAGAQLLQSRGIAEGIPLCKEFAFRKPEEAFQTLGAYGGSVLTVKPELEALDFIYEGYYHLGVPEARDALVAIAKDSNPKQLKPLKVIHSIEPGAATLMLPVTQTTLSVKATNYAIDDVKKTAYTWRKLYGAGEVAFSPNGTWEGTQTTVTFVDGRPGKYRFEVTMSDVLGYTDVRKTVDVTLVDATGTLPPNQPPVAKSQTLKAIPGIALTITLAGSDPDGDAIGLRITRFPNHGTLSGTAPNITYKADLGYAGPDACVFEVVDGQGVATEGKIDISVQPGPVAVTLYEGFSYPAGNLIGAAGTASFGFNGGWLADDNRATHTIGGESVSFENLPSIGRSLTVNNGKRAAISRKLDVSAFSRDGLLRDSGELWFSVIASRSSQNAALSLELTEGTKGTANGVGMYLKSKSIEALANGVSGNTEISQEGRSNLGWKIALAINEPCMFLGHCVWGKSGQDTDEVRIYRVVEDHRKQVVVLRNPVSVRRAVVNQTKLDTLFLKYDSDLTVDEIRVGTSRASVLLGTDPTKGE